MTVVIGGILERIELKNNGNHSKNHSNENNSNINTSE